ncbi:ribonucleotide reductase, large subunit (plasmid) [Deferribacter desulfuricans SSM1]|uniref:Vitamin B12-dependent ribonucleotide reductase n=1 Tax=Deferribacter desulfuricans (strain DSM 14783 / JCM 11476 / NBRC 101012 / SSM1) TaxID=639282 RepID=D3PF42_DEFDS|nr:adenosylcobalamin-dependent ribonucleoside-diphosphate reductase [Deferribacter desulfuricans]BAI81834.1 ribonucleotide reductase, large subunit [Deferribacter desulfuricans SSM1]
MRSNVIDSKKDVLSPDEYLLNRVAFWEYINKHVNEYYSLLHKKLDLGSTTDSLFEGIFQKRNKKDYYKSFLDVFHTVAFKVASAKFVKYHNLNNYVTDINFIKKYVTYFNLMAQGIFMPNSPLLVNADSNNMCYSACFVLDIDDSMESIFETLKNTALIHKSGGGTGFNFSKLRQKGALVSSTKGESSGALSFMQIYNSATEHVKQGGVRRGANMGILNVDHPDIEEFIKIKRDNKTLTNFNISVGITNKFLEAIKNDEEWELKEPNTGKVIKKVRAKQLFDEIVKSAWICGDPGLLNIDTINKYNYLKYIKGNITATNPCGEQPLFPNEACNLGSINLAKFVKSDAHNNAYFDIDAFAKVVEDCTHFLDDVIDINNYPLPQITEAVEETRKIGLGVMGFADALIKMGISYDSNEALTMIDSVGSVLKEKTEEASIKYGEQYGVFPLADKLLEKVKKLYKENKISRKEYTYIKDKYIKRRNASLTCIAPTGTISLIAGCSSGIEPLFSLGYIREDSFGTRIVWNDSVKHFVDKNNIPEYVKTAMDISPDWHLKIQSKWQEYVESAVSKTINLPETATEEDIANIYLKAMELNCKGITVYRDKSKGVQVLNTIDIDLFTKKFNYDEKAYLEYYKSQKNKTTVIEQPKKHTSSEISQENTNTEVQIPNVLIKKERPQILFGLTREIKIGPSKVLITINYDNKGNPFECIITTGKSGSNTSAQAEALGRLISQWLRVGLSPESIIDSLSGISGQTPTYNYILEDDQSKMIKSLPDAIGYVLSLHKRYKDFFKHVYEYAKPIVDIKFNQPEKIIQFTNGNGTNGPENNENYKFNEYESDILEECDNCGSTNIEKSGIRGCYTCKDCGYSKCS